MKIIVEFHHIDERSGARAVVQRDTTEATDFNNAVEIALRLWRKLDLPQRPNALRITDIDGNELPAI